MAAKLGKPGDENRGQTGDSPRVSVPLGQTGDSPRVSVPLGLLLPQRVQIGLPATIQIVHRFLVAIREFDQRTDLAIMGLEHGVMRGHGSRQRFHDSGEAVESFVGGHAEIVYRRTEFSHMEIEQQIPRR